MTDKTIIISVTLSILEMTVTTHYSQIHLIPVTGLGLSV